MLHLHRSTTTITPARPNSTSFNRAPRPAVVSAKMGGAEEAAANGAAPKRQRTGHEGHSTVVILDYGSQYSQLITRRVREIGVFSVMLPGDADMVRREERGEEERAAKKQRAPNVAPPASKRPLDRRDWWR